MRAIEDGDDPIGELLANGIEDIVRWVILKAIKEDKANRFVIEPSQDG